MGGAAAALAHGTNAAGVEPARQQQWDVTKRLGMAVPFPNSSEAMRVSILAANVRKALQALRERLHTSVN